jgi:hypothetical protein
MAQEVREWRTRMGINAEVVYTNVGKFGDFAVECRHCNGIPCVLAWYHWSSFGKLSSIERCRKMVFSGLEFRQNFALTSVFTCSITKICVYQRLKYYFVRKGVENERSCIIALAAKAIQILYLHANS